MSLQESLAAADDVSMEGPAPERIRSQRPEQRAQLMSVMEPLGSYHPESQIDAGRINVVRLVDAFGPISPELALVDPQLAAHARALLPDVPATQPRERREPLPLPDAPVTQPLESREPEDTVPSPPQRARISRPIPWRLVGAVAAVALLATAGLGAWTTLVGADPIPPKESTAETESTFFATPPSEPDVSPDELAALETAVRRDPQSSLAREALATAYFRLRQWVDAEREFRALVALTPSDDFAHFALGRALANQGRQAEAASQFKLAGSLSDG